ncbi:hypothetical protein MXE38_07500 [Anaerobiospirillum sp. NML120448]|uniref:hypothetical protein n=1 Tax=Anaerobiospirillum sp. NML120448 TaxID=2932816 RepID=UPI001FF45CC7|nr:hypothetical protein [Anaerobiospirillum sp. NML120448]MCK0514685.1 hypothetical protein [Anaerobiospirillum sp. NML120448]
MANLISSVDALFSYYGATLFVLGLLCCFTKRTFKFGVLTLLLADIPLALAIAFPRKVIEQLNSWGFQAQDFPDVQTGHTYGIIAGVVTFVVLFAIRYLLNSMLSKRKVIAQKSDNSDDAPIDIAEDDPSINQSSADNKIFKGLAIKGKKSHQSASALHLSSDDNPLNLADTQAEFSALKKNDEHGELANNLGSEPSFAQDPHESFSLGQVPDHDSDNMKEPTLSSDVFTNHMSHNEPSFSNSFIENASLGSLKHNYAAVQKPLENQASVGIASLGVQNPLTGQTDNKEQSGSSSWSSLFSKINQAQENTNSSELQERFSSLDGDDSFSGYGPKSKSIAQQALKKDHVPYIGSEVQDEGSLDLNNLSFAGNKVGDLLEAIDDPNQEDKLKERLGVKDNSSQPESAPFNFADILDSAAKRQSLEEENEKELDSYDQLSMQPHNVDRMGDDNVSPAQLSEEQLAYAALGKSHKTVAEALADLDSQEQELEPELETATASAPAQSPAQPNEQADTHINSELLEGDNKKVDIGSPDPSLQIMEPTKISYLYSDPVHEDKSKEEEEERPENVLDQYQGDSTNYSFSIKGVFKEKPKLSVSSFVDRTSYLGQSQYEANFHEEELEQMVNANEAKEQIEPQIEQAESNSDKAEDLKNKRDQVLAIARQVAAQISAELDAKQSSSHINKEQSLDLLSNNDQEALQPSVGSSKKVAEDFAIDSHHTDDAQDEAHALASLFAHKKAPQSASARSASADSAAAAAADKATATAKVPAASVEVAYQSKSLEQKLNNGKELAKQSVSGLESKNLTEVIGSQDNDKFIDAERLDLAPSEEQKREDNKDIEIQPLNKAASILNPSERKVKRTVNIGASLEALKAKAKQAAQERAIAKEAALKAKQEAEQKAAQEAALKAEKEAEQKAAQEAAQAKILAAQKAQSQAEARAYKAAQNKDHSAANNQPKHFNIQHVAAPIESKSTLNNIAKRDNKVNVARDRGLSFIEKLKVQAKNASKPKADAAVLATSKATPAASAPAKVNAPAQASAPANAHAVAVANATAKSASGELKAQPNKATVQDKQQVLAKTNATASQKATNPATAQSKAPAVAPAKAKVEVQVPPKVATSAKTNASASVPAKDPALVKAQSATKASVTTVATAAPVAVPAKAPAQAPATKEAKTQATGKVGANASAKPQAQALAKSKTDSGALDNKKGSPVEAVKTEVVTAKATAQAPAQAQVPVQAKVSAQAPAQAQVTAKEQATGKEQALAKEHEHEQASAQSQVVKASLKNKKRNHKKAEDGEKVELSQEALKKDEALASMSSLDDLDEKVMLSRPAADAGTAQAQQSTPAAQHAAQAQGAQGSDAAKADGAAVRKSASLKRSFGLKRNRP